MTGELSARAVREGEYILENNCTVREAAVYFNISKSTLHQDVSVRLKKIDLNLYKEVHKILEYHFSVRHLRGGEATKKKYKGN